MGSKIKPITLYWAGPLFTQAERIWNRLCAEYLRKKGYDVILPQDEGKKFKGDCKGIAKHCFEQTVSSDVFVAVLDGADTDSGTSLEAGIRIRRGLLSIGVRTDFRASEDGQLNAMFRLFDTIIYFPSFDESYEKLCDQIDQTIRKYLILISKSHFSIF